MSNQTEQIELNFSSSALKHSGCIKALDLVVHHGYKEKTMSSKMRYGIGVHKFIQVMYLTGGHIPTAREEAVKTFLSIPEEADRKAPHLSDANHMHSVALWTWEMMVKTEPEFEILQLNQECEKCKGKKWLDCGSMGLVECTKCNGVGSYIGPAVEVNYSLLFFEDKNVRINWCGTLDRIGKLQNGIWLLPDWKSTSSWDQKKYFIQYEMAKAPRGYVLALHLMAERYPDSILGQIGKQTLGVRFDAIFIKPAINEVQFARSDVYKFMPDDERIREFRVMLEDKCREISLAVQTGYFPRQGILNGSCEHKYGKCLFWNSCKLGGPAEQFMLKRDFEQKPFTPLNYND